MGYNASPLSQSHCRRRRPKHQAGGVNRGRFGEIAGRRLQRLFSVFGSEDQSFITVNDVNFYIGSKHYYTLLYTMPHPLILGSRGTSFLDWLVAAVFSVPRLDIFGEVLACSRCRKKRKFQLQVEYCRFGRARVVEGVSFAKSFGRKGKIWVAIPSPCPLSLERIFVQLRLVYLEIRLNCPVAGFPKSNSCKNPQRKGAVLDIEI
jgi:hypothetical protein